MPVTTRSQSKAIGVVRDGCEPVTKDCSYKRVNVGRHRRRNGQKQNTSCSGQANNVVDSVNTKYASMKFGAASFKPCCGNLCLCENIHNTCCYCADKRPIEKSYPAYNNSLAGVSSRVGRTHFYCPTCKFACNKYR